MDNSWRPENWEQTRRVLAKTPLEWSASKAALPHLEQIIEATANKVLEELLKVAEYEVNESLPDEARVEIDEDGNLVPVAKSG